MESFLSYVHQKVLDNVFPKGRITILLNEDNLHGFLSLKHTTVDVRQTKIVG